jgi:glycosyltransferase involved in cell wall biosynthesis
LFPDFYPLLIAKGYEVVGISADGPYLDNVRRQGVRVIAMPIARGFAILQDIRCLWKLYRLFRRERFDIIHYSTMKASLLSAIAGGLAGRSALLWTIRGLLYPSFRGIKRFVIKSCDRVAGWCADCVIAISPSLREEVAKEGILPLNRIRVLGAGSSRGVNLERFSLTNTIRNNAVNIRSGLGISQTDFVIGYAGRMSPEKGIGELVAAFSIIKRSFRNTHLLLVGDQDERCPLGRDILEKIGHDSQIHMVRFVKNVEDYIAAMDMFVMPTYRDGFGNSIIEASAMERLVIGSDIPGCRDALIDGVTGYLVRPKDIGSLETAMRKMLEDPEHSAEMGKAGRQWVTENFDRRKVWQNLISVYEELIYARKSVSEALT